jgi:hypothetical protein
MSKIYTGVGSRQTPGFICELIEVIARRLGEMGWTVRSGGADGADSCFAQGAFNALTMPEIYLPWPAFNKIGYARLERPQDEAYSIAKQHHPAWDRLSRGARMLHARNVHQVLGPDVTNPDPSRFLICWTPDAMGGGGTGQAIRIAKHYEVPVFDLADSHAFGRVEGLLIRA